MSTDDQQPGPLPWRAPNRGSGTSAPDPFAPPAPEPHRRRLEQPLPPRRGPVPRQRVRRPAAGRSARPAAASPAVPGRGSRGRSARTGRGSRAAARQGPDGPRDDTGRAGKRRRPTWVALVGTAAGAALLASVGTAGLTGTLDGTTAGNPTGTTQSESRQNSAPVVTSTTKNPDWANVADAVRPTVVAITVQTGQGTAQGSGVIIDAQGHIVTNHHVVGDAGGRRPPGHPLRRAHLPGERRGHRPGHRPRRHHPQGPAQGPPAPRPSATPTTSSSATRSPRSATRWA